MKRSRTASIETELIRLTPTGEEFEIEVEVSATISPYWPGNYDNPPEGGEVDDLCATFWDESAKKRREIPLTGEETKEFMETLSERASDYDNDYDAPDDYYDEDYRESFGGDYD